MGKFITELKVALINWMNVGSNRLIYDSFIDMFKKYSGLFELTNEQHFDGDEVNQRFQCCEAVQHVPLNGGVWKS